MIGFEQRRVRQRIGNIRAPKAAVAKDVKELVRTDRDEVLLHHTQTNRHIINQVRMRFSADRSHLHPQRTQGQSHYLFAKIHVKLQEPPAADLTANRFLDSVWKRSTHGTRIMAACAEKEAQVNRNDVTLTMLLPMRRDERPNQR